MLEKIGRARHKIFVSENEDEVEDAIVQLENITRLAMCWNVGNGKVTLLGLEEIVHSRCLATTMSNKEWITLLE